MTDQERKAMQMALDALDSCEFDYDWEERPYKTFDETLVNDAVDALRKALVQPEQEPVAWLEYDDEGYLFLSGKRKGAFPVFTAKPSKPWVSLTDEEIECIWGITKADYEDKFDFPRKIEAKLKEKNT